MGLSQIQARLQGVAARLSHEQEPVYTRRMPIEDYITIAEAAQLLGLKPQQIRDMIKAGLVPEKDRQKVGNVWLIKRDRALSLRPRKKGRPYKKK